jgi:hypothetical protein
MRLFSLRFVASGNEGSFKYTYIPAFGDQLVKRDIFGTAGHTDHYLACSSSSSMSLALFPKRKKMRLNPAAHAAATKERISSALLCSQLLRPGFLLFSTSLLALNCCRSVF